MFTYISRKGKVNSKMQKGNKTGKLCWGYVLKHLKHQTKSLCLTLQAPEAKEDVWIVMNRS